jgi:glycosyltransferase involved in cell wall biosynthesis
MVSVSLCMIVKNEEDVLNRCLESAAELVDEIIIRPLAKIEIVR